MFLLEKNIEGISNLSVFKGKSSIISMIVLMFKEKTFDLAIQFMKEYHINPKTIAEKVYDNMICENNEYKISYLKSLSNKCDEQTFLIMFHSIVNRLVWNFRDINTALFLIKNVLDNQYSQCKFYIQFGYLNEAIQIAISNEYTDLIPLIGCYCLSSMNHSIYAKCLKYLENHRC